MKYIIIEDEDNGANLLQNLVTQNFSELSFGGRAKGVPDGIELINKILLTPNRSSPFGG